MTVNINKDYFNFVVNYSFKILYTIYSTSVTIYCKVRFIYHYYFLTSLLCSTRLWLLDQRYSENSNIVKYYNLKYVSLLIFFKMQFTPMMEKQNFPVFSVTLSWFLFSIIWWVES